MSARERRLNTPPTWRSSISRAVIASALVFVFLLLTSRSKDKLAGAVIIALVALVIYVPAGYYLELMLYRRRQRRKAAGR